jgi:hypothetical protein
MKTMNPYKIRTTIQFPTTLDISPFYIGYDKPHNIIYFPMMHIYYFIDEKKSDCFFLRYEFSKIWILHILQK